MSYELMPAPLDVLEKTLETFVLVMSITGIGVLALIVGCFAIVAGRAIVNRARPDLALTQSRRL